VVESLPIDLVRLTAAASAGAEDLAAGLPAGLTATDLLTALAAAALRETASDLELLHSVPARDDAQFGDRPRPAATHLEAWLYSAAHRVAYAVHTPSWSPPDPDPDRWTGAAGWSALLREHLHGDFHAGRGWTAVNAVAMPVHRPFDEPGLRIRPLLALWPPVSQTGDDWFSETMTATVRDGGPHVTAVRVFSAAAYLRRLTAAGRRVFELTGPDRRDRRPALTGPYGW
jgi:hypothetical protein